MNLLGLDHGAVMGLQRSCTGLANRLFVPLRPSCCRAAFDSENFIHSGHRRVIAVCREISRERAAMDEGSKKLSWHLIGLDDGAGAVPG
jgi:hypothetical protein